MSGEGDRAQRFAQEVRREWPALVVLLLLVGAIWFAVELADEVTEGATQRFDRTILLAFRAGPDDPIGPAWVELVMRDITALGGTTVLTLVTLAIVGYELLLGQLRIGATLVVAVVGGVVVSTLTKAAIDRPRPDIVSHAVEVSSASFPSGHSMMAATVYLTLAALLIRFRGRRAVEVYVFTVATVVTLLVGISRVYLGVHWPTDVIAGWTIGAAWALLVWAVAVALQRRDGILPADADRRDVDDEGADR